MIEMIADIIIIGVGTFFIFNEIREIIRKIRNDEV